MIYQRIWRPLPLLLMGGSLALHLITLVLYTRLPDRFSAYTVFPIWVWGTVGIALSSVAFLLFRARLSLLLSLIWASTVFLLADETQSLGRLGQAPPKVADPFSTIRVITLNCRNSINPSHNLTPYDADIIFLQEIPSGYSVKKLVDVLFQGNGDYRYYAQKSLAIITRGHIVPKSYIQVPKSRCQLATVILPGSYPVQVMNLHLHPAATNLRLWSRKCWRAHHHNRLRRRIELAYLLTILHKKPPGLSLPTFVAGDFNAPSNDTVYRQLKGDFKDAFETVGSGWGNTYPRVLPLLRIDHIFASHNLQPERSVTVTAPDSDHRMVVADFIPRR